MARKKLTTLNAMRRELYSQQDMIALYGDKFKRLDDVTRVAWRDLDLAGASLGFFGLLTAPDPVQINGGTIYGPGFNGVATTEQLMGSKELDHDWFQGSNIYPHVHWMPSSNAAGDVHWQLTYTIQNSGGTGFGDVVPAETTLTATDTSSGTAWQEHFAGFGALDITGILMGAQINFRLFRDPTDPADTYGADAVLMTLGFHMQVQLFGSRTEYTK